MSRQYAREMMSEYVRDILSEGGDFQVTTISAAYDPYQIIMDWFDGQEPEVNSDIAMWIMVYALGLNKGMETDSTSALKSWLSEVRGDHEMLVGRIIFVKGIVDFAFADRFEPSGWAKAEGFIAHLKKKADAEPESFSENMKELNAKTEADLPRRKELWAEVGRSWSKIVESDLSTQRLRTWYEAAMLERATARLG